MNGKMAVAYKGDYVQHDIDLVNKLLYNDLPIDELFDDETDTYKATLKKLLVKGEVAKHIPFLRDEYYITNFGRIINAKRVKEITVTLVLDRYLAFTSNGRRWKIEPLMIENKWDYNITNIMAYYKVINYPFAYKTNN